MDILHSILMEYISVLKLWGEFRLDGLKELMRFVVFRFAGILFLALLCSCASVNTENIVSFAKSADEFSSSASKTLNKAASWCEEIEMEQAAKSNSPAPENFMIETRENFSWTFRNDSQPFYVGLKRISTALRVLDLQFVLYLSLMGELRTGALLTEKEAQTTTSTFEKSLKESLKESGLAEYSDYNGIISAAAAAALNLYLKTRGTNALADVIKENNDNIDKWAALHKIAFKNAAVKLKTIYAAGISSILSPVGDKTASPAPRLKQLSAIFELNDRLMNSLDTMVLLDKAVEKIPEIHKGLIDDSPGEIKTKIRELNNIIEQINENNKE
jgi:hypothetical protein